MPMPDGLAKLELWPPAAVHCPAKASVTGANSSTRRPTVSETSSPPAGSAASPRGPVSAPSPRAEMPIVRRKRPSGLYTSMRSLAVFAT